MSRYAADTDVTVDRSRGEIERTLLRYGATEFMYGYSSSSAIIGFRFEGQIIRIQIVMPDRHSDEFTKTTGGNAHARYSKPRTAEAAAKAWEQACRQRWRALALVVKAKLEAVDAGITTVEQEFLAHIVLPDGRTFGQWAAPQLEAMGNGKMPALLPGS